MMLLSRSLGGIPIDVVIREEHKAEMEIAEHPIERGAKVSDHAWRKPYSVTLESLVAKANAMATYEALLAVQKSAEPFDLITGLKLYDNMLIKSMNATRDKEKARVLYFEAECQEVIIVSTESGQAPAGTDGKTGDSTLKGTSSDSDAAKSTTDRGQVQAREVTTASPGFHPNERLFAPPGSI